MSKTAFFLSDYVKPFLIGVLLVVTVFGGIGGIVFWRYSQLVYPIPKQAKTVRIATPPMGWNGWNHFGCSPTLNESTIKEMVDALVSKGYQQAGYQYVMLDDCWQIGRDKNGVIQVDSARFPNGIKAISEYVHSKGLKFGIYTSAGRETCEKKPGSYGYEAQDLEQYINWGADYLKLDWCGVEWLQTATAYRRWRKLIDKSGNPMILSVAVANINSALDGQSWLWGSGVGDSWRTAVDIQDDWTDMLRVFKINQRYEPYQRVGGWNDADMLQVGNGGMTFKEYRTHFGLWAMMSSPLIIGSDIRNQSPEIVELLTNKEAISINQDKLGMQGSVLLENGSILVISKPLHRRGSRAVLVVNTGEKTNSVELSPTQLQLLPVTLVTDVWPKSQSRVQLGSAKMVIPPHDSRLLIYHGVDKSINTEVSFPQLPDQVRSGNLTKQVAHDLYGIDDSSSLFSQGISLTVKNDSSIRYNLNNLCQRFISTFEFSKVEKITVNTLVSIEVEVYLDDVLVSSGVVSVKNPKLPIDLDLSGSRVIDLVTRTTVTDESTLYGKWSTPTVECAGVTE